MEQPRQYEDVIDLGKYIATLFRQWRLILVSTLVCTIATFAYTGPSPITYQASALVATTRSSSEVSFGSSIDTTTETDLNAYRLVDRKARLNSFVELIKNPVVAESVVEEIGDKLNGSQKDPRVLINLVSGEIVPNTDSIIILVTHGDPNVAAAIANAWAKAYVNQVNDIYSEGGTYESYLSIQSQVEEAKVAYDIAQEAVVEFKKLNRIAELNRQIAERETLIETYINDLTTQIDQFLEEARRVDGLIIDAQSMLDQVNAGGASAVDSNILALMLLKNQAFVASENPTNLTIQTAPFTMTHQSMVKDISSLISAMQDRRDKLDQKILSLSNQLFLIEAAADEGLILPSEKENEIQEYANLLEEEVRILNSQLAEEEDHQQELDRARELAWSTYQNLSSKAAELGVEAESIGTELALSSPATVPLSSKSSDNRMILFAGAAGFIIGVLLAYSIEFWWNYNGIEPQPITVTYIIRETKKALTNRKGN